MRLPVDPERPSPRKLQPAIQALSRGAVILYPTDTGYCFGCALSSAKGISELRRLKGIHAKHEKPLTMLVNSLEDVGRYAHMSTQSFRMIRRLLPGAYTVVLRALNHVPRGVRNRAHEVGMRMPDHPVCSMLVAELGEPLLTGSVVSLDDTPELQEPEELELRYGRDVRLIIDGGPLWPEPSTVLRFSDDGVEVLREGQGPLPS